MSIWDNNKMERKILVWKEGPDANINLKVFSTSVALLRVFDFYSNIFITILPCIVYY